MKTATQICMIVASLAVIVASYAILMTLNNIETEPVGKPSTCLSYRWEMGRLVKDCD